MTSGSTVSRRRFIKTGSLFVAAPAILRATRASAQDKVFKIGLVSPLTGPLAGFGEAQDWLIAGLQDAISGLTTNGAPVRIELIAKDSQSNPNRAAEVASALILNDGVNLILTKDTPDTTNPVCDQPELNEISCISTNCPWQPWFFGRGGNPEVGFTYTCHFFWGPLISSPTSPPSGTSPVRRKRSAVCSRMTPTAILGAIRRWVCRGHWRHSGSSWSIPAAISP